MQKGPKGLLQILKDYRDLQGPALKVDENNLNNFRSNSEPSENLFKSFKNASEGEIKPKDSSKDQLEAKWV